MQARHSPGPWKAVQAYGYKIKAADGKIVATLPTHCPLTWECPANAYLVAAAPDLLAACRMALDVLEDYPDIRQALVDVIAIAGTGRSDFANQTNNSLGFPGIFRGVLDVRASTTTDEMAIAAAEELAR